MLAGGGRNRRRSVGGFPSRAADDLPSPPPAADFVVDRHAVEPVLESDPLSDIPTLPASPPWGRRSRPPLRRRRIDSTYFVEPAEFFALDLPVKASGGAKAVHILGDIIVVGGRRDLIVRLSARPTT